MLIAAVYLLIAPKYLPTTVAYAIPLMFASMALGIFGDATTTLAASYRSLPLLTNQWLWPPLKYECLRLAMLVPPGITLITFVMMADGYDSSTILKTLSIAVPLPFIIQATLRLVNHTNETRDRIGFSAILVVGMFVIPVILAGIASVIGQFALDWPMNLSCVPITLIALGILWKLICYWQDKGSVDHYVAPKN
jgi:heme/copper-type cytochrome/quinol oxidase subunit 4